MISKPPRMEIQQRMGKKASCNMLLLFLSLLIAVTFSTPTGVYAQNPGQATQ
jgi:hypothetical protein